MLNLTLADVALWTHGRLHGENVAVRGVFSDTRTPQPQALFVALKGDRYDGHEFVGAAQAAGAVAALVSRAVVTGLPQIIVADTQFALGDLASAVRAQRRARVVGITGSNGKTTVKTLLSSILSLHGKTHVNAGNFNNEIGLPLSLLALPEDAEFAVLEMGAGKPGDIAYLAAIARPEIGLVNNIAPAHLERMGSLEGIAETKGALYAALPAHGIGVINADDRFAPMFTALAGTRRTIRFGIDAPADVRARLDVSPAPSIAAGPLQRFTLELPQAACEIALPLSGRHNVMNALAAAAVAHGLGVPAQTIRRGLEAAAAVKGRLQRHAMRGNWLLIDDSYNANPGSAAAAIDALAAEAGEAWLVLGDMRELGAEAAALHAGIGRLARQRGIVHLYTAGPLARAAADAFGPGAFHFGDQAALIDAVSHAVRAGIRVLVKGSRGSAMDRVVRALLDRDGARGNGGDPGGARDAA